MKKETKKLLKKLQVAFSKDDLSYAFFQKFYGSDSFTAIFVIKNRKHYMDVESLSDYMDVMDMFDFLTGDPLIAVTNDINGFKRKKNEKIVEKFFEMLEDE
jgi:hypothetical protein